MQKWVDNEKRGKRRAGPTRSANRAGLRNLVKDCHIVLNSGAHLYLPSGGVQKVLLSRIQLFCRMLEDCWKKEGVNQNPENRLIKKRKSSEREIKLKLVAAVITELGTRRKHSSTTRANLSRRRHRTSS